jgi:hypothetical protein
MLCFAPKAKGRYGSANQLTRCLRTLAAAAEVVGGPEPEGVACKALPVR